MARSYRFLLMAAVFAVFFTFGVTELFADSPWPDMPLQKDYRGPGGYLSLLKIMACWLVFLTWVWTTDWVSTDSQALNLNYLRWNPIVFGVFMLAFVLVWIIPFFWVGFILLLIAYIAPLTTYIVMRNKTVENDERVMTREHLRWWSITQLNRLGMKIPLDSLDPNECGPPVKLKPQGAPDERTANARFLLARQSPGLLTAREIIAAGLAGRANALMLDYTQQGVSVRRMVDGVWIPAGEVKDRELGDPALESLKLLCGLNPQDRKNRQEGKFSANYESEVYTGTFISQGTATGERVVLQFEDKKVHFKNFEELGMRPKLQEQLRELLSKTQGFALFSAPAASGLRSTTDIALRSCDRFVREFVAVESDVQSYPAVENIQVTTYNTAEGQTPVDVLPRLLRTEPDCVVVRDLVNGETVKMLCEAATNNRMIVGTVRAGDCAEAMLRVLSLGIAPAELAKAFNVVVGQRLVRKLCESCKEAYTPTPEMLRQLGIPAGRVQAFYRPPQPNPEQPKEPCKVCGGIGYLGRTAIYEVLPVGETVRKTLVASPKVETLRQAARRDGMKSLQEEGIMLVIKGVTSLPELTRILKQ